MINSLTKVFCLFLISAPQIGQPDTPPLLPIHAESFGHFQITERGAHHRVFRRDMINSKTTLRPQFTEMASGMHYEKDGMLLPSPFKIMAREGGAVAQVGPFHV